MKPEARFSSWPQWREMKGLNHDQSDTGLLPVQNMPNEANCESHAMRTMTGRAGEIKAHRR